jgi:hypothetical protein
LKNACDGGGGDALADARGHTANYKDIARHV